MGDRDVIPLTDAAVEAGCSERTVYLLIAAGSVEPRKVRGDRRTHVSLSEVRSALAALPPARRRPRRWRPTAPADVPPPEAEERDGVG